MTEFAKSLLLLIRIAVDNEQLDKASSLIGSSLKMETITRNEYEELASEGKRRREELKCQTST